MKPIPKLKEKAEYLAFTTGSRIYERRRLLGLSQADVGAMTGIKTAAISHFECARRIPHLRNLLRLCGALECTPNDLLLER